MILRSLGAVLALVAVCTVTSCAIPAGVDPLPYFAEDPSGNEVEMQQLCILYYRYGFLDGDVESCNKVGWKLKELSENDLDSKEHQSRRNELQHTLLSMATKACGDYRKTLTQRSETFMIGPAVLALFLSAGSVASHSAATELTATATAVSGVSQLTEESYTNDLVNTQMGIELARTRIFKQILNDQNENLLKYPVSRAINDAKRYHAVCNRTDGRIQASRALSEQLSNRGSQEPDPNGSNDETEDPSEK